MSDPSEPVTCKKHGTSHAAYVCGHLIKGIGVGFFFGDDDVADPRPDAWCARCDEVLQVEGEWNDHSEPFANVSLCCAGCYDDIRSRNTWHEATSNDSFVCSSCDEQHEGLPYDFAMSLPSGMSDDERARAKQTSDTFELDDDRWVRACLEIPIIGGPGPLVYGVWVTLSATNFEEFVAHRDEKQRYQDGPYFGWFGSALPHWPDTMLLKTRVHMRPPPLRPVIELEPTDHPLAVAQREGITRERHRTIALELLHAYI